MNNKTIHVEEEGLKDLGAALSEAGESYKQNVARLSNLIDEITSGDIKGNPADDLLQKYQAKAEMFKNIANSIDDAEDAMGLKTTSFGNMLSELKSGMK